MLKREKEMCSSMHSHALWVISAEPKKRGTEFVGGNVSPGTVTARGKSENESQDRLVEPENSFFFHPPRLSPGFAASPC